MLNGNASKKHFKTIIIKNNEKLTVHIDQTPGQNRKAELAECCSFLLYFMQ